MQVLIGVVVDGQVGKVLRIPKQWKQQVEHDKKVQLLDGILWRQELGMESIFSAGGLPYFW